MATIDTSYVRRELQAIAASSSAVKKLLYEALEGLEKNPSAFPRLEIVPPELQARYPSLAMRKVYIETGKHSYRLVVAHWTLSPRTEHVDVLYAFPRKKGYPIDWDKLKELLQEPK